MVFTTRVNNTALKLKMKLVHNTDLKYDEFYQRLMSATINFSMVDTESGKYKIANKKAKLIFEENEFGDVGESKIYLAYEFSKRDLNTVGYYRGEFGIYFNDCDTELHVPVAEKLYINILDSITKFN